MTIYEWRPVMVADVAELTIVSQQQLASEVNDIFIINPNTFSRNLILAAVNQYYNPLGEFLAMARDNTNRLLAYTWAVRGETSAWSDEPKVSIRMAHIESTLPTRTKIRLLQDMLELWEGWARHCGINIICSNTMRKEQRAFLRLHEQSGYVVRGSVAYKRLSTT